MTCIPKVQPQAPSTLEIETQTQVCSERNADKTFCKILLSLKIVEQGLNVHVHLVQLLKLAQALNRTLVLSNIGKNRVGACRRWRSGVYYNERVLLSKLDDANSGYVSQQDRFKAQVDSLGYSPTSQLISSVRFSPKTTHFVVLTLSSETVD